MLQIYCANIAFNDREACEIDHMLLKSLLYEWNLLLNFVRSCNDDVLRLPTIVTGNSIGSSQFPSIMFLIYVFGFHFLWSVQFVKVLKYDIFFDL
jgi:hypothetical protein